MDARLQEALHAAATALPVRVMTLPSAAGHDAATFPHQGAPSAMIFVRNEKGSHNPDQAMSLDDFLTATQLRDAVLMQAAF